jgi:hypothetical protein
LGFFLVCAFLQFVEALEDQLAVCRASKAYVNFVHLSRAWMRGCFCSQLVTRACCAFFYPVSKLYIFLMEILSQNDLGTTLDSLHTYTIVGFDCIGCIFSDKTPTTTIAASFEIYSRLDPAECGRVTANLESYRAGVESFSELPPFLEADLENLDDGSVARDFDNGDRNRDVADQATGTSMEKLRQAVTFQDRPVGPTYRSKGRGSTRTAMNELLGAGTDENTAPQEMSRVRDRTPKCCRPPPPPPPSGGQAHP